MKRILFIYWGRRGLLRFTEQLAETAEAMPELTFAMSLSRQSGAEDRFRRFGPAVQPVDTFSHGAGALTGLWRAPALARAVIAQAAGIEADAIVNLMSHVWSPLVTPAVKRAGYRYVTLVHDAEPHPGDWTGLAHRLILRDAVQADRVVTLSRSVTRQLSASGRLDPSRIATLFHPRFRFGALPSPPPPRSGEPLRLLFLGRVMPYKGLSLLVEALELLAREPGAPRVGLSVQGEGDLSDLGTRLAGLSASVVNRWLSDEEIGAALAGHHAVVLSHVEASQSGIAAAALGAGVPVIAMPVGGLPEQVIDGTTGLLAAGPDAPALAAAIRRLAESPELHASLLAGIAATEAEESMETFLRQLIDIACPASTESREPSRCTEEGG